MRRFSLAAFACLLALTGCGSAQHTNAPQLVKTLTAPSGQRTYKVRLPDGRVVTQAHSPALAEPTKRLLKLARPTSSVPTVEQYDSVTVSTIPRSAHYAAGYVDGLFRTYRQLLGRFPVVVGISVSSRDGADCLDMEPGNPPVSAAGPWAKWQLTQGNTRPCEYTMLSWMPAVRASLAQTGVAVCTNATQTHCVRLWDANWTYARHLDLGYACTQWTDHSGGLNLDESSCATWFYKVTPPKPKPPKPSYNENFQGGFLRGFTVAWDRRRRHTIPAPTFAATNRGAFNTGFQDGFAAGWKAAR